MKITPRLHFCLAVLPPYILNLKLTKLQYNATAALDLPVLSTRQDVANVLLGHGRNHLMQGLGFRV
jgi:hypothetical protein